jgi:hypothetical protein
VDQGLSNVPVEDIEHTLGRVAEIKAARVVASPEGIIQEIHVLALPDKSPKQLVRDIESTIMASFGIPVDHKKISIAQLGAEAVPEQTEGLIEVRARIQAINANVAGVHATTSVSLEIEGDTYLGEASGPASSTGRQRLVALATLDAIEQYVHGAYSFALEDVSIIQLGRERVAVSCVTLVSPLGEQSHAGSALVRQNEKDSIVRSTLDAINRRLGFLTTG